MNATDALRGCLIVFSIHPLLERLFFASVELAVLALVVFAAIRFGRIRSARLASVLWLLVLAKPIVSLAVGSPFPLLRMEIRTSATAQSSTDPSTRSDVLGSLPPTAGRAAQGSLRSDSEYLNDTSLVVPQSEGPSTSTAAPIVSVAPSVNAPPAHSSRSWDPAKTVLLLWLSGTACLVVLSLLDRVRVLRLVLGATRPEAALSARYDAIVAQLKLRRRARLGITSDLEGPALVGSISPTILIPVWLAADKNHARLDWALRHELMHWKLLDPLASLVREVAQRLFYFHPAAWWAGRQWEISAERACDRAIVTNDADSREYAEQLYGMLVGMQGRFRARIGNGLFATRTQIGQRIAALLNGPRTPRAHLSVLALVSVTAVTAITLSIGGAFADKAPASKSALAAFTEKTPPNAESKTTLSVASSKLEMTDNTASRPAKEETNVYVIRGRVLLPDGRPAAGARVFALRRFWYGGVKRSPLARTTAGPDGTFAIRISKIKPNDALGTAPGLAWVAAEADGFGAQWQQWNHQLDKSAEVALKLVPELPIHGRIVDWEGKPVAGVHVMLLWQQASDTGLSNWLEAVKSGTEASKRRLGMGGEMPGYEDDIHPPQVTDQDGRFTLAGIGVDRVARLELRGETIAYAELDVVARAMRPILRNDALAPTKQLFGSDFTYQAKPTRPIVGTVRDATTGVPLAGVRILSRRLPGVRDALRGVVHTQTDAEGRYRLIGLPATNGGTSRDGDTITVVPDDDQPYFVMSDVKVPNSPGLAPATLDFKLSRGLWITGRVTEKATGAPVPCRVQYFPTLTNPFVAKVPELTLNSHYDLALPSHITRPDGSFRLVGLPGPGIVTVMASNRLYRTDLAAAQLKEALKNGNYPAYRAARFVSANALKEINPTAGADSEKCDLVVDPGGTVRLSIVDGAGKPASRCYFCYNMIGGGQMTSMTFESPYDLCGMAPNESRLVLFLDGQRRLGKILNIHYDNQSAHSLTVKLEPCATVKGRVVDEHGGPRKNVNLSAFAKGQGDGLYLSGDVVSGADGTFKFAKLVPGAEYYSFSDNGGIIAEKVRIAPGETAELGDVTSKPRPSKTR